MPRCDNCAGRRCDCVIVDGNNTQVLGSGSPSDPYVINVDAGGAGGSRLPGEMLAYAGATAPPGWLLCNGQAVSRSTYAALYAICGTTFGIGDGSTTFNVPDLAGRFPYGADGPHPRGSTAGAEQTTLTQGNLPAHTHTMAHRHNIAHTHGMSHTHDMTHSHGDTAGQSGNHRHNVNFSTANNTGTGGNGNRVTGIGGGGESGQTTTESANHTHATTGFTGSTGGDSLFGVTSGILGAGPGGGDTGVSSAPNTGSVGSGTAFTNMPPYTAVTYLIKT